MSLISDSNIYIPEGFPLEGNEKTLELVRPALEYLVCIDKQIICSIVNILTLNIKPINEGHDYNSNFIVLPKGFGKTTFLKKFIHEGNDKNVYLTPSKHFESQLVAWDKKIFDNKTWINLDAITLLSTLKPTQRAQLVAFYTEALSDGFYHRDKTEEIHANMNILYGMAADSFYEFQRFLQDSTIFDRVIPIYFFPTDEEKELIRRKSNVNRTEHRTKKTTPLNLPYSEYKYDFVYENKWEMNMEIDKLSEILEYETGLTGTRGSRYVSNFICSNAYINGRTKNRVAYPEKCDIELFKWLIDIHYPLDKRNVDYIIYNLIKELNGDSLTADEITDSSEVIHFLSQIDKRSARDIIYRKKKVRVSLNMLERRGMIQCEHRKGASLYWTV